MPIFTLSGFLSEGLATFIGLISIPWQLAATNDSTYTYRNPYTTTLFWGLSTNKSKENHYFTQQGPSLNRLTDLNL